MTAVTLSARALHIPLRATFKQASFERRSGASVWVDATRGGQRGLGEGCPRDYVTGETVAGALDWIGRHGSEVASCCTSLGALREWREERRAAVERNPAAWCAVETALLDLFAREEGRSVEALLGLSGPVSRYRYSAILSDAPLASLSERVERYLALGMTDFKLKLNGSLATDLAAIARLAELAGERRYRLRVDANNLWGDDDSAAIDYLRALDAELFAVEEPLAPKAFDALSRLSRATGLPVILDESATRAADVERAAALPGSWLVNIKVSKAGGLLGSLEMLRAARRHGWRVVVGAHVGETSLLTRCAMAVAHAAGADLTAHEGGFGTLAIERDPVIPVLTFGAGGILDLASPRLGGPDAWNAGLGLREEES